MHVDVVKNVFDSIALNIIQVISHFFIRRMADASKT